MQQSLLNGSSEFLHHESCDNCGSSDAKSVYSDGHSYCFSCHHWSPGDSAPLLSYAAVNLLGEPVRLNKRNLSEDTCKKYRIFKYGDTLRFAYYSADGRLLGAKIKPKTSSLSMKERPMAPSLDSTYFPPVGSVLSSLRES
jgi:twinkle protein